MTNADIDELGPVDYLVVEFPPGRSHFTGEMAAEIGRLVDAKLIRVLDLLILQKAADGTIEALEIDDLDQVDELRAAEGQLAELLAEEDVAHLAAAMEPGTTAGVARLGELLGGAVRVCGSPRRWPTHRQRPHSHPSYPRLPGGRRIDRRRLICHSGPYVGPVAALLAPPLRVPRPWSGPQPSCPTA